MHRHTRISMTLAIAALGLAWGTAASAQTVFERSSTIGGLNKVFQQEGGACQAKGDGPSVTRLQIMCDGLVAAQLSAAFTTPESCIDMRALGFTELTFIGVDGQQRCRVTPQGCPCDSPPAPGSGSPLGTLVDSIQAREALLRDANKGFAQTGGACNITASGPQKRHFTVKCPALSLSIHRQNVANPESCAELHAIGVRSMDLIGVEGTQPCTTSPSGCNCKPIAGDSGHAEQVIRNNVQATTLLNQGQHDRAQALLEQTLQLAESKLAPDAHPTAQTRVNLAFIYQKSGDPVRAIPLYERALPVFERIMGPTHEHTLLVLSNFIAAYHSANRLTQAIALSQRALPLFEKHKGLRDESTLTMMSNLALMYQEVGDFGRAGPLSIRSLKLHEAAYGRNDPRLAASLNNLALFYDRTGQYTLAEPLYNRCISLRKRAHGERDDNTIQSMINLAMHLNERGDYERAATLMTRNIDLLRQLHGDDHPDLAQALGQLGQIHQKQGLASKAEVLLSRSLEMNKRLLGPRHPMTAESMHNLAALLHEMGQDRRALPLAEQALSIMKTTHGNAHPDTAWAHASLGLIHQQLGQTDKALPLLQESYSILKRTLGSNHPDVYMIQVNIAQYYLSLGEYSRALPLLEEARAGLRRTFPKGHPLEAGVLSNMSILYQRTGKLDLALEQLEAAHSISRRTLGTRHPTTAKIINNLASLFYMGGEYPQSIQMSLAARDILLATFGPKHPEMATQYNNLAVAHHAIEKDKEALDYALKAHGLLSELYGPNHLTTTQAAVNLAGLYEAQGQLKTALEVRGEALDSASRQIDLLMASPHHGESTRLAFMASLRDQTDALVGLSLRDGGAPELALRAVLQRKGRVLDAMAGTMAALRRNMDPDSRDLMDQWASKGAAIAALTLEGGASSAGQIEAMEKELEALESALASKSARFETQRRAVTMAAVQSEVPEDAALVEWVLYRPFDASARRGRDPWQAPRYAAFVLKADGAPEAVDLGPAKDIDEGIRTLREAIVACASEGGRCSESTAASREAGAALYTMLMAPIEPFIEGTGHLLMSPDGGLNLMPFEALVDGDGAFVIDTHPMTYLSSGRDLVRSGAGVEPRSASVILANPDYGGGGGGSGTLRSVLGEGADIDLRRVTWPPLPGTGAESAAIGDLLPNATRLEAGQATETALKQVAGPRILHVATHGFFLASRPPEGDGMRGFKTSTITLGRASMGDAPRIDDPLLRSGLVMAGGNGMMGDGTNDGIATAREIAAVDLFGTRLAVLSACETGLGEVDSGDGVFGLRRALVLAGSESQVMSLWQVSDEATKTLMIAFYRRLDAGQGRTQALRGARLELRGDPRFESPFFWAAFIPSGDWRTLEGETVEMGAGLPPKLAPSQRGCACQSPSERAPSMPMWPLAVGLAAIWLRRRMA